MTITIVYKDDSYDFKRAFIIYNTTDSINLKVKNFDYSIFNINKYERYIQICQGMIIINNYIFIFIIMK